MSPLRDLIATELPRHVDLILYDDGWDTGGLRCSCGEWERWPTEDGGARPRNEFHEHVADAIHRRISAPEAYETLVAVQERLTVPRVGTSYMREMDKDIRTLQAAAAILSVMLCPREEERAPQEGGAD